MDEHIKQEIENSITSVAALPWKRYLTYAMIALGAVAGLIFLYNRFYPPIPLDTTTRVVVEAPAAAKVEKVYVPGPAKLRVYKKEELAKKIPLSTAVTGNPSVQVTATASIPPSPYGGIASSFTNMTTGISAIEYTPTKRPVFGFGGKTNFVAMAGVSTKGDFLLGGIEQPVARISAVTIGAFGGGGMLGGSGVVGGGIIGRW